MTRHHKAKAGMARIARPLSLCVATTFLTTVGVARAQETLLIQPALPDDFDRGRNISVLQRERPDYDPIGINVGSFIALPQLNISGGYSDNLYYSENNKVGDGYIDVAPSFVLKSNWSRNQLTLKGSASGERYFSESTRNQTPWDLGALGAIELGSSIQVIPELQIGRQFETPFSVETISTRAALSSYMRKYAGLRTEYSSGQTKLTLAVDNTNYQFSDIEFQNGVVASQADRDRNIFRVTGQGQYAFTPSMAAYLQLSYANTVYDRTLLTGAANRDSDGYRIIGGFNFDLSGLLRGSIGVGYVRRDFNSPLYRNVGGFSAEGKLEYFPSELTTVTLAVRRVIEDTTLSNNSGFFDNRASLRIDHELLRNLLLRASGEYAHQDIIDVNAKADVYRFSGGASFLSNNWLNFNLDLGYTGRSTSGANFLGQGFNEFRGQVGVTFKR